MADEDEAVHAAVRGFQERQGFEAPKARVVGVDGVVVVVVVLYSSGVHRCLLLGRAPGCSTTRGAIFIDYPYCLMGVLASQDTCSKISGMEISPTKLRELRAAKGLSVRGLAREAGISTETVYSVEHGSRQPSIRTLGKIARALGVEARDLFA